MGGKRKPAGLSPPTFLKLEWEVQKFPRNSGLGVHARLHATATDFEAEGNLELLWRFAVARVDTLQARDNE